MAATPMDDKYRGKHVLVTGVTGFVGKVVLEKLFYEFPDIGRIYVIVRGKKGVSVKDRFDGGVCMSPIWKVRCRPKGEDDESFVARIHEKVQVVQGEVDKLRCGINDEDFAMLNKDLDIIIHCAASIDFNGHLTDSCNTNVGGATEMLPLLWGKGGPGRQGRGKRVFVHVSTCYVGYPKGTTEPTAENRGDVPEAATDFPYPKEAESLFAFVKGAPREVVKNLTPNVLNGLHSNTYTFTKAMAETLVTQRCNASPEDSPLVVIVRPSCVGASVQSPHPGWIDAATANGAMFVCVSLGLLKVFPGRYNLISDQVPVDFVTNAILLGAGYAEEDAQATGSRVRVIHAGTSDSLNPISWGETAKWVVSGFATCHYKRFPARMIASRPVRWLMLEVPIEWVRWYYFATYRVPGILLYPLQIFGGSLAKASKQVLKLAGRVNEFVDLFTPFTTRQFIFERKYLPALVASGKLDPRDVERFNVDPSTYQWPKYIYQMMQGLTHYVLLRKKTVLDVTAPFGMSADHGFPSVVEFLQRVVYASVLGWLAVRRTAVEHRWRVLRPWVLLHLAQIAVPVLSHLDGKRRLLDNGCMAHQTCPPYTDKKQRARQMECVPRVPVLLDYSQHALNLGFAFWLFRVARAYTTKRAL